MILLLAGSRIRIWSGSRSAFVKWPDANWSCRRKVNMTGSQQEHELISLPDARQRGLKYFFTGAPCKRGHQSKRFACDGACVECKQQQSAAWYSDKERARLKTKSWRERNKDRDLQNARNWRAKNRAKMRLYSKRHRDKDPEARRAACRTWYQKNAEGERQKSLTWRRNNLERARASARKWVADNPEQVAILARTRRARKKKNGGTHTIEDLRAIFGAQNGKCAYCRVRLTDQNKHVDHIVPLARGGGNDRTNLQFLCSACNQSKSHKDPLTFCRQIGLLI